ncbi:hypothetical protein [Saccharopolyspora gregorii]|uniref:hypothetical protein n=1 Tax=Saccharopolyspora gregorii TaxID=33914 RepID=UPI0031F12DA5
MGELVLIHHARRRGPRGRSGHDAADAVRPADQRACDPRCGVLPGLCAGVEVPPRGLPLRIVRETGARWACGPSDGRWHRLRRAPGRPLRCLCGHRVEGPAHLRRARPNPGHLGRALCASAVGTLPMLIA